MPTELKSPLPSANEPAKYVGLGLIAKVNGTTDTLNGKPTGPGLSITYDVTVNLPQGSVTFAAMKPDQNRHDCMIYPPKAGDKVKVFTDTAGRVSFECIEIPAWKTCT